jgi:hypothetical protein
VREYCKTAGDILTQLERDRQLPRTHLMTIVDVFSECTVTDFKVHWMGRRTAVETFIKESAGKDDAVVRSMPNYIHFLHLLDEGKQKSMNLQHKWGPTKDAEPSQAAMLTKLTAQVATLNQKLRATTATPKADTGTPGTKEGLHCFACGKPGYTKKNCPACKAKREANAAQNGNANATPPTGSAGKWVAPKDGEPTEKMIDGVKYYYCAKCRRGKGKWNKNHTTEQHQVGFLKENKSSSDTGSANLAETSISQGLYSAWSSL